MTVRTPVRVALAAAVALGFSACAGDDPADTEPSDASILRTAPSSTSDPGYPVPGPEATDVPAPTQGPTTSSAVPTTTAAPATTAAPLVPPLAAVDVGAGTGPPSARGLAITAQAGLDLLGVPGLPLPVGATTVGVSVDALGIGDRHEVQSVIGFAVETELPNDEVLARLGAVLPSIDQYELGEPLTSQDEVPVAGFRAEPPLDTGLPTWQLAVWTPTDEPTVRYIELVHTVEVPGPLAPPHPRIAAATAPYVAVAGELGWLLDSWTYTEGWSPIGPVEPVLEWDVGYDLGARSMDDVPGIEAELAARLGPNADRLVDPAGVSFRYGDSRWVFIGGLFGQEQLGLSISGPVPTG